MLVVQQCRWFAGLVRFIVSFPFLRKQAFDLQQYMDRGLRGERGYLGHGAKLDNVFFFILACKNTFCNR